MNTDATSNPYQVPDSAGAIWLTANGFTPGQCLVRFFVAGVLAAVCGSAAMYAAINWYMSIVYQLLVLGLPFGVALWLAMQRYIGNISTPKKIVTVVGGLSAFGICGAVYLAMLPRQNMIFEPLSWELMPAYIFGPGAGAIVITIVLWLTGGRITLKILSVGWIVLTIVGGIALFISDEAGVRRRIVDEALAACVCGGVYVSVVLAMIGWLLAEANSAPAADDLKALQPHDAT